jgi:predicted site-specific integrase-resolvase
MTKTDLMTVAQFADEIGVARNTVSRWVQSGKVKGFKKDPFQGRTSPVFIPKTELERVKKLMAENDMENGHSTS